MAPEPPATHHPGPLAVAPPLSAPTDLPDFGATYAMQVSLLLNMVRLSRLGGIATVECDNIELRKQLFRYFQRRFLDQNIYLYPVEVSSSDLNLVRVLRDLTDRTGFKDLELVGRYEGIVLFVYGIEKYSAADREKFLQFLNLFRDATTIIKQPIVIWASSDFMALMAREAPDFWSWKGLTLRFETESSANAAPDHLPPLQRYAHDLTDDPDFAVWRDLYVPLRGSLVQVGADSLERLTARPEPWHEAFFASRRWTSEAGEERGWVRLKTSDLLEVLASHATARALVLGGAGAGKTTLLRYLTCVHARHAFQHAGASEPPLVPIFVKLNQLRRNRSAERLVYDALQLHGLQSLTDIESLRPLLYESPEQCEWAERVPRFLLLLDGLNEMPFGQQASLQSFLARLHPRHTVFITCRTENYAPIEGFQPILIETLNEQDIGRFAMRYLGDRRGRQLATEVTRDAALQALAANPLALFMLTQISLDSATGEALPKNRGVLFHLFTESLLRRTETEWWKVFGRSKAKVTLEVSKEALAQLGLTMQRERLTSLTRERCYWLIKETAFGTAIKASAKDIFEGLLFSGLVRLSGDRESIEFIHQAVREYFAAVRLRQGDEQIAWYLNDPQQRNEWIGTTVTLFGITSDRTTLFREIVRDGEEYQRLWLAAECLANVRQESGAWETLRAALSDEPHDLALFVTACGMVYEELGDFDQALHSFREAIEHDPEFPFAYYDLAVVFRQIGQHQNAIAALRRCIRQLPNFVDSYNQLGITYYETGDMTRALMVFSATVELEPQNAHHHYNVGFVYKSLNQYDQAKQAFHSALRFKPDYEAARAQLALIEEAQRSGLVHTLDTILLFQSLPLEHRVMIAKSLRPQRYAAGEAIITQGEVGDEFYIIEEGLAEVSTTDQHGRRVVLNRLGPGDHFGEIALLEDAPHRTATVVSLTPLRVLSLRREIFKALQSQFPDVAESLVQTSYERLQQDLRRELEASLERYRQTQSLRATADEGFDFLNERVATILIADIHDSTPLTQALGAQTMLRFLKEWYMQMIHVVGQEGVVRQTVGDQVLAIFDDPVAAARCAIQMQQSYAEMVARWSARLSLAPLRGLGIGLCTGPVAADDVSFENALAGSPVILAARLSARSKNNGDIFIDDETHRWIEGIVPTVPLPQPTILKGFDRPIQLYRIPHELPAPPIAPPAP